MTEPNCFQRRRLGENSASPHIIPLDDPKEKRKERSKEKKKENNNKILRRRLASSSSYFIPQKNGRTDLNLLKAEPQNLPVSHRFIRKNTPPRVSGPVQTLLNVWYDYGLREHKIKTSVAFKEDVHMLNKMRRGILFKDTEYEDREEDRFTVFEFEKSVEHFSLIANHSGYWPEDKVRFKRMWISDFLYHPKHFKIKSWFLHCLDTPPRLLAREGDPELTQAMAEIYIETTGEGFVFDLTRIELNHFVEGSALAQKIFNNNPQIPSEWIDTPRKKARLIFDALKSYSKGNGLKPHWFSNPLTYNRTLIEHLKIKLAKNVIPMNNYIYR